MVLNPVISKLAGKLVVLASASPRRLEILSNVGLRFEVVPSWFKETLDKGLFKEPHEYAVETAKQKALEVARRMPVKHLKTPDIVIGADTIVTVDGMILEKPADKADAYRMLSLLSGKEHSVFTGVAIVFCHEKENEEVDYQLVDFYEETKVKFADLSDEMLWEYINSGEPMDKAGGYGIQALGGMLVEYVHGDFLNVVGFPLNRFFKELDLIYNQSASSPGRGGGSARPSHNGAPANSPLVRPPPKLPAHSGLRPTSGPLREVERKGGEHEANGSSTHLEDREAQTGESENATLPLMTSRGPSEPEKEDMQRIIDLMDGFKASKALFTASKLCVFDLLHSRPGLEAAQVAREVGASVRGAECLLEACVSLGLLRSKEGRCQRPVFENTDLSARFLLTDAPRSLRGHIARCDDTAWPLFSRLDGAVREGAGQRQKALGETSGDTLQDAFHNAQEDKLGFMNAMHSVAKVTGRAVATAFDLSRFKTACDLGGCTGAMAYEFTRAHPGVSVTVFDLPAVIELSERFHPLHTDTRVSFVAGDFFEDELPKADLYILARILHDLPEEKVHILLSKISAACTPGCGLLLSEIFLDAARGGPARGLLQALSLGEGRQRSAAEYALLLESHGFVAARGVHTGDLLDAMLCLKA